MPFSVEIEKVKELLSNPKRILITTHRSPDGDAIGSSLGLYHYLLLKGHKVSVFTPDDYPEFLHWMPGHEQVKSYFKNKESAIDRSSEAEVIFCLDFNAYNRLGEFENPIKSSGATKIVIDHHRDPEKFEDFGFIDVSASSTSQMIYEFIIAIGDERLINKDIADCLYTGIVTDTGSFKFSSTTARTHEIAAEIIRKGSNVTEIQNLIYNNSTEYRLRLLGYAIGSKLLILKEYNTAIIGLNKQELDKFNYQTGDTEGIVNYPLSIKGIEMAILITEKNNEARISFRSKGDFEVNEFAKKFFNGGGHKNAAGGIAQLPIETVITKITELLKNYKGSLY